MPRNLWYTFRKEICNLSFFVFSLLIASIYILFSLYILNYRLINDTIIASYSLPAKLTILVSLIFGLWTTYTHIELVIMLINAILVGVNTIFIIRSMKKLRSQGAVQLSVGGATIMGFVAAGCSSCGLSVLAILGVSSSFSSLPFKGVEIQIISMILLLVSFIYMLRHLYKEVYCKIPNKLQN